MNSYSYSRIHTHTCLHQVWGLALGFTISGTASLAANLIAFSVGRHFFRERLSAYITANVPSFPAIQGAIVAEGWR